MNYLDYVVKDADSGGFHAVASSATRDRDDEIIDVHAFTPLPEKVPCHLGHDISKLAGSATPYYEGIDLLVDGTFARNAHGREARDLVLSGHLRNLSVMFRAPQYRPGKDGVRHIVKGELLAVDLVSVPSNREAVILSARSYNPERPTHLATVEATLALAKARLLLLDLDEAEKKKAPSMRAVRAAEELLKRTRQ